MCAIAIRYQLIIDIFDVPNNQVLPRKADDIKSQIDAISSALPALHVPGGNRRRPTS